MHWHKLVGRDGRIRGEHAFGEVTRDGFSCQMKVAEHLVRPPTAEKPDDIGVDIGDKEGHGSASSEGTGGDFRMGEA